jgi:short-subunit dehydrogenase
LNAGAAEHAYLSETSEERIQSEISLLMQHPIFLTKKLLGLLQKRGKRSAIVFTGSVSSHLVAPGLNLYASCKAAVGHWMETLSFEVKNSMIDVMTWDCGSVSTKINQSRVGLRLNAKTAV